HTLRFPKPIIAVRFQDYGGKRRNKSDKKCIESDSMDAKRKRNEGEEDIFTELLAGRSTSDRPGDQMPRQWQHSLTNMTVIDIRSAILFEPGLRTFLSIGNKLFCCVTVKEGFMLSAFNQIVPASGVDTLAFTALPCFKVKISLSPVVMPLQENKQHHFWNKSSHLFCVQPANSVSLLPSCAIIERSFYNKLFSPDSSLVDSPVLIFGSQDGQLHFWPVNDFAFSSTSSGKLGATQTSSSLLHHLEQAVSAIYVAKVSSQELSTRTENCVQTGGKHKSSKAVYCNALVFVGVCDKLVIALERKSSVDKGHSNPIEDKGHSNPIEFTEHAILGPVVCSCLNSTGDTLIHSTGKEIFFTKFSFNEEGNSAKVLAAFSTTALTTFSMHLPNICAVFSGNKKRKSEERNIQDKVFALALNGKLLQFCVPDFQDSDSLADPDIPPQIAGAKVKSYLADLENLSAELAKVHTAIEAEDKILKELNTFIHFACQLREGIADFEAPLKGEDTSPLCCSFKTSFSNLDNEGDASVTLNCKLVNQGSLPLSSCWSLMICVESEEAWLNKCSEERSIRGRSVPMRSLSPGSLLEIQIPLIKSMPSSFHIVAEAYLHCNLNAVVYNLQSHLQSGHLAKCVDNVIVPVARQVLDVLHFVTPFQAGAQAPLSHPFPGTREEIVKTLDLLNLETAYVQDLPENEKTNEVSLPGSYSASFHISQEAVNFIMNTSQKNLDTVSVLQFIMKDSSVTIDQLDPECSDLNLLTVNCNQASIHVKPTSGETLEVLLRCSTVQLLCHLHEAVLRRLKPAVLRDGRNCQLKAYALQKALEKLQVILQKKLMSLEDAISIGHDVQGSDVNFRVQLWTLYEELRKIVLLV
ncbi:Fanconi anemia core complex-associated protein 100, partial [Acropora cervicornis]